MTIQNVHQTSSDPSSDSLFFGGSRVQSYTWKSRRCWLASDIGRLLGYSKNGSELTAGIRHDWADEFERGADFDQLTDFTQIAQFRSENHMGPTPRQIRPITFLYDAGVILVCLKTTKSTGPAVRRTFLTQFAPKAAGLVDVVKAPVVPVAAKRTKTNPNITAASFLKEAIDEADSLGTVNRQTVAIYRIKAAEMATGMRLDLLLPPADPFEGWLSPSQIAESVGVTVARVGAAITALDLRTEKAGICRSVINLASNSSRQVTSYQYSPIAVALINDQLTEKTTHTSP